MKKYFHQKLHTIVICIKEFGFRIPVPVPPFFFFWNSIIFVRVKVGMKLLKELVPNPIVKSRKICLNYTKLRIGIVEG